MQLILSQQFQLIMNKTYTILIWCILVICANGISGYFHNIFTVGVSIIFTVFALWKIIKVGKK